DNRPGGPLEPRSRPLVMVLAPIRPSSGRPSGAQSILKLPAETVPDLLLVIPASQQTGRRILVQNLGSRSFACILFVSILSGFARYGEAGRRSWFLRVRRIRNTEGEAEPSSPGAVPPARLDPGGHEADQPRWLIRAWAPDAIAGG